MSGKVRVATCQFAVSGRIKDNSRRIQKYIRRAKRAGADVVHFPECALSGYIGADCANFDNFDWELLKQETLKVMSLAGEAGLWVVLGSTHPLSGSKRPHNSLYLISPEGKIKDRYDKRFCMKGEQRRYTPGDHFVVFEINGVKCALLICFDVRFPEVYRELYRRGVKCIYQSFYNARQKGPSVHTHIMRQSMQCRAASNGLWVSMANASGYYSPYPSCFIGPDGVIIKQLRQNRAGMMVNTVDLNKKYYDPMAGRRELAIKGMLSSSAEKVKDRRSTDRMCL